ncbi:hypothetical protein GQ54DRAFT_317811 [Martensiomyces pterosporus]|nr:hypothetical protein GQ54DRAFT_317811 [Martensiomyces pterosporus]
MYRILRRTQSATASTEPGPLDDSASNGTLSLDSDSESDFPDPFTLLKSPAAKQKTRRDRVSSSQPELGPVRGKPKSKRSRLLVRSASDVPPPPINDEADEVPTLKVPGELVLACSMRKYYPARVISQLEARKFKVEFFDGTKQVLSRKSILSMYDRQFYTCSLGAFQLIGDEPVDSVRNKAELDGGEFLDLDKEFERDKKRFGYLVDALERIRPHLEELHGCAAEELKSIGETEDRMPIFFGGSQKAKRLLSKRVSMGCLNRAEFDFIGRLLCQWFETPPRALETSGSIGKSDDGAEAAQGSPDSAPGKAEGKDASDPGPLPALHSLPSNFGSDALTAQFIHEVLVPHAIKRLLMEREGCSLAESEARMLLGDSEVQWVDQILAARGISH